MFTSERILLGAAGAGRETYWINSITSATGVNTVSADLDTLNNLVVSVRSVSGTFNQAYLLKYNDSGVLQWQRAVSNATSDVLPFGVKVDASNNIYTQTQRLVSGSNAVSIAKHGSDGVRVGEYIYFFNSAASLLFDPSDGNIISQTRSSSFRLYIGRLSVSSSSFTFVSNYEFSETSDVLQHIDSSGIRYVTANRPFAGGNANAVHLVKYGKTGLLVGQVTSLYEPSTPLNPPVINDVTTDASGNIYIAGVSFVSGVGETAFVNKYNSSGGLLWNRGLFLNSDYDFNSNKVSVDESGNVYTVCEARKSTSPSATNILFAKRNSSGTLLWQRQLSNVPQFNQNPAVFIKAQEKKGIYAVVGVGQNTASTVLAVNLPADGSRTGTYGGFTYTESSYTSTTPSLSSGSFTFGNIGSTTVTTTSQTTTDAPSSLTSTTFLV